MVDLRGFGGGLSVLGLGVLGFSEVCAWGIFFFLSALGGSRE